MNKYEKALLDLIAYTEGTLGISQNGYDVTVNFRRIIGWTPDTDIIHGLNNWYDSATNSTAAGRYQFLGSTWKSRNGGKNLPLTKENQDKTALDLAKEILKSNVIDNRDVKINELDNKTKFDIMLNKLSSTWASLPLTKTVVVNGKKRFKGSSYYNDDGINKTRHTSEKLYQIYKKALGLYN
jgi:muramidase (phage lysozyme)